MNLEITEKSWSDQGVTLSLRGEIDVFTAAQVRQKIHQVIEKGCLLIVANLQDVTYLDSTGLGVFIGSLRRVREREGNIAVVCSHPRLLKIFDITGLVKIFKIFADEKTAQEALTTEWNQVREETV